jgi:hypothetical protein
MNVIVPDDFDIDGHLSNYFIELKPKVDALAPGFFETAYQLNRIAQDALYASVIKTSNESQYVRYLLFLHVLRTYQGLINLIYFGLQEQSIMLLRIEMEALFKLKAIRDKPGLIEEYQKDFPIQRKTYAQNLKKLIENGAFELTDEEITGFENEMKELEKVKKNGYKAYEWAESASLQNMYMMLYPMFSQPIHSNPHQLDKYLVVDKYGIVTNPNIFPKYDQLQKNIHLAMTLLLIAIDCIDDIIKTPKGKAAFTDRLRIVKNKLKTLADKMYD